jgi:hypothetical protein
MTISPAQDFSCTPRGVLIFEILFLQNGVGQILLGTSHISIFENFYCVTSWCSGILIGSPRQRFRVQDPISTINIHEGGH